MLLCHVSRCDQLEQLDCKIAIRIRFRLLGRAAVHDDAHDSLSRCLLLAENVDGIAVTLAHFLAIRAGDNSDFFADLRLRNDEGFAIEIIEFDG